MSKEYFVCISCSIGEIFSRIVHILLTATKREDDMLEEFLSLLKTAEETNLAVYEQIYQLAMAWKHAKSNNDTAAIATCESELDVIAKKYGTLNIREPKGLFIATRFAMQNDVELLDLLKRLSPDSTKLINDCAFIGFNKTGEQRLIKRYLNNKVSRDISAQQLAETNNPEINNISWDLLQLNRATAGYAFADNDDAVARLINLGADPSYQIQGYAKRGDENKINQCMDVYPDKKNELRNEAICQLAKNGYDALVTSYISQSPTKIPSISSAIEGYVFRCDFAKVTEYVALAINKYDSNLNSLISEIIKHCHTFNCIVEFFTLFSNENIRLSYHDKCMVFSDLMKAIDINAAPAEWFTTFDRIQGNIIYWASTGSHHSLAKFGSPDYKSLCKIACKTLVQHNNYIGFASLIAKMTRLESFTYIEIIKGANKVFEVHLTNNNRMTLILVNAFQQNASLNEKKAKRYNATFINYLKKLYKDHDKKDLFPPILAKAKALHHIMCNYGFNFLEANIFIQKPYEICAYVQTLRQWLREEKLPLEMIDFFFKEYIELPAREARIFFDKISSFLRRNLMSDLASYIQNKGGHSKRAYSLMTSIATMPHNEMRIYRELVEAQQVFLLSTSAKTRQNPPKHLQTPKNSTSKEFMFILDNHCTLFAAHVTNPSSKSSIQRLKRKR